MGRDDLRPITLSEADLRGLLELACTPFSIPEFEVVWKRLGWRHRRTGLDEFGFGVKIAGRMRLQIAPEGDRVGCAYATLCYWEECDEEDHETTSAFVAARRAFDEAYETAKRSVEACLGPPRREGRDDDEDAHRHSIWEGSHGILILQQCAFDPQFGLEINLWLEPGKPEELVPTSPLIDWLTSRNQPEAGPQG